MNRILGIIPARLGSTRLPEKLLLPVAGKPLLYYTWRQAVRAQSLSRVIIATDSLKIQQAAQDFGADAVMTSLDCPTGSDRVAEAARSFDNFVPDIVVNIQGDEPLVAPAAIDACVSGLIKNADMPMSTVAAPVSIREADKKSVVKVVVDGSGRALYFSRTPIPYPRHPYAHYLRHIGLYAFRLPFLFQYVALRQTPLEIAESLEQLRALENGYPIHVTVGDFASVGVDTLADFKRIKKILASGA